MPDTSISSARNRTHSRAASDMENRAVISGSNGPQSFVSTELILHLFGLKCDAYNWRLCRATT